MKKNSVGIIFLLVLLVSCTSTRMSSYDYLSKNSFGLDVFEEDFEYFQLIEGRFIGEEISICEAFISYHEGLFEAYMFAPTGQTIVSISFDGNKLESYSSYIPNFDKLAKFLLLDMQFCFGKAERISENYEIKETKDGVVRLREIKYKGRKLYKISYCDDIVTVENLLFNYEYTIENL